MSDALLPSGLSPAKTLAVTEEIRLAVDAWIEKPKADPAIKDRAAAVRAEIEREAATKRSAIEAIFNGSATENGSARRQNKAPTQYPMPDRLLDVTCADKPSGLFSSLYLDDGMSVGGATFPP